MSTGIDGKVIVNTLYHSGTVTLLTLGYSELFKNLFRIRAAKADFNMTDFYGPYNGYPIGNGNT